MKPSPPWLGVVYHHYGGKVTLMLAAVEDAGESEVSQGTYEPPPCWWGLDGSEWWAIPVTGGSMLRLNAFQFYRLGYRVNRLTTFPPGVTLEDMEFELRVARSSLIRLLIVEDTPIRLPASEDEVYRLLEAIQAVDPRSDKTKVSNVDTKQEIKRELIDKLEAAVKRFETVLENELTRADIYAVSQKGIYSTSDLIDRAEMALGLPEELFLILPEPAKTDLRMSGRCLAFEIPTAAGFHVARATEAVIVSLIEAVGGSKPKDSQRNWGNYIKVLKDSQKVDPKVTHHLEQVKDLHRNPLIHPEETLTMPEAVALWSVCTSLIGAMLTEAAQASKPEPAKS